MCIVLSTLWIVYVSKFADPVQPILMYLLGGPIMYIITVNRITGNLYTVHTDHCEFMCIQCICKICITYEVADLEIFEGVSILKAESKKRSQQFIEVLQYL